MTDRLAEIRERLALSYTDERMCAEERHDIRYLLGREELEKALRDVYTDGYHDGANIKTATREPSGGFDPKRSIEAILGGPT